MYTQVVQQQDPASLLAQSLDCFVEADLCLLADITPGTAESWRKRGKGPAYILVGNKYLYPRSSLVEFLQRNVRARTGVQAKGLL
jgi:Helix-turn-helix domain